MPKQFSAIEIRDELVDRVFKQAIAEHPDLLNHWSSLTGEAQTERVQHIIRRGAQLATFFEHIAYQQAPPTIAEAKRVQAFWLISHIGGIEKPVLVSDPPSYQGRKEYYFMSRRRFMYTEWLVRRYTEQAQQLFLTGSKAEIRRQIAKHGPLVIFNGTPEENVDLRSFLSGGESILPQEKVHIIEAPHTRVTLDQVYSFRLPAHLPATELGIVCHAGQLMRLLHLLNQPHPQNYIRTYKIAIKVFPLPVSPLVQEKIMIREIQGLLARIKWHQAAQEPYPFSI